jgi:hypothetical protein
VRIAPCKTQGDVARRLRAPGRKPVSSSQSGGCAVIADQLYDFLYELWKLLNSEKGFCKRFICGAHGPRLRFLCIRDVTASH